MVYSTIITATTVNYNALSSNSITLSSASSTAPTQSSSNPQFLNKVDTILLLLIPVIFMVAFAISYYLIDRYLKRQETERRRLKEEPQRRIEEEQRRKEREQGLTYENFP